MQELGFWAGCDHGNGILELWQHELHLETGPFPKEVIEQVELTLAVHHSDNPPTKELRAHSSIS